MARANAAGQTTVTEVSTPIVAASTGKRKIIVVNKQNVSTFIQLNADATVAGGFELPVGAGIEVRIAGSINAINAAPGATGKVHWITTYE